MNRIAACFRQLNSFDTYPAAFNTRELTRMPAITNIVNRDGSDTSRGS
jgi:hypothetical protein